MKRNECIKKRRTKLIVIVAQVPYADAMSKTLVFAIYDFDRFSKHDQIGEVKMPLCMVDLAQTIEEWGEVVSVEGDNGQVWPFSSFPLLGIITTMIISRKSLEHKNHVN